jgi:phage-related protein
MATFTITPDRPISESSAPRARRTVFPNYEQRTTFGINPMVDTWDLVFSARTATERDDLFEFFEDTRGIDTFQWTTPFGETASFICQSWDTTLDSCNLNTVQATFELQYTPQGPNLSTPAAPTGSFVWLPEFAAKHSYQSRAKVTSLGDGYKQRILMGLSPQEETWSLAFNNRTDTERNEIRDFLRGAKGTVPFEWEDPRSTQALRFVCAEWNIEYSNYNNNQIQATFRRVFEP